MNKLSLRNNVFDSMLTKNNLFEQLFDGFFTSFSSEFGMDQVENEDGSLSVSVDVPGVKEEDLTIEVKNNMVSVKGERKTKNSSYSVNKSFSLPEGYHSDDVQASLDNGVLTLTLPAKLPASKDEVKRIPVKSSVK